MGALRVGLGQRNTTVGDFEGNVAKLTATVREAEAAGVDLLVFPELALCGYPPEDLLHAPAFVLACREALAALARSVGEMVVVVGTVDGCADLYNAAAVIHRGKVVDVYHKVRLPNYGVFDELRYFEPGRRVPIYHLSNGLPFAVTICEDMWQPGGPWVDAIYRGRARLVLNLSASPYHAGKIAKRENLFAARAYENHVPVVLCNLVGGQDELVFDGTSAVFDADGEVVARAGSFCEELVVVDLDDQATVGAQYRARPSTVSRASEHAIEHLQLDAPADGPERSPLPEAPVRAPLAPLEELYQALVLGVQDYCGKNGFPGVVIGLSGGIDSALTAAVAVDALGAERVTGVTMPSRYNSAETRDDARLLADNLGIDFHSVPIEGLAESFEAALAPLFGDSPRDVTEENIQARARGTLLMALANKWGRIVLATGNKSELATGYCTLYGDMVGGFAPLKDVYKTLVFDLSWHANARADRERIPVSTIERPPSAELKEDQRDEDALCPYPVLDRILRAYLEEDLSAQAIGQRFGFDDDLVRRIVRLVERNEYKRRQGAVGLKVTARSFAKDRRVPLTHSFF